MRTLAPVSNFVQWAQLGVGVAQLGEMQHLNAQFQAQHDHARRQALLTDMLFRTEQRAKQLSIVAEKDPLVAAMLAEEWLASVGQVTPELFVQLEHKRTWTAATGRLHAVSGPLQDPAARALVQQVRGAGEEARRIQQGFGGANPEQRLAVLQHERAGHDARATKSTRLAMILGAVAVALPIALLIFGAIAAAALPSGKHATVGVDFGAIGAFAFLIFIGCGGASAYNIASWSDARAKSGRLEGDLRAVSGAVAQMQAFSADPNRGGVLTRFYAEHPAYGWPLPAVDDAAPLSAAVVSTHVVERQIVMVRCKFCQALTPVDGATCRHCGAGGFS